MSPARAEPSLLKAGIAAGALALVLLGAFRGLDLATDLLFYPWARADPPLTDTWVGRLMTGDGSPRGVVMELWRAEDSRGRRPCARCAKLEGTATTCDAAGRALRYRISGSPDDRHATQIHLGASSAVDPHPDGLQLSDIRGRWDGADTLAMEADFFWRRGASAISSTDDPATQYVPLRMTRGTQDAFHAICRRLASR